MKNVKMIEKYEYDQMTSFTKALIRRLKSKRSKGIVSVKLRDGTEWDIELEESDDEITGFKSDRYCHGYGPWFLDGTNVSDPEKDIVELLPWSKK